jgi:IclR family KDG regulon transcriptional repressor
VSRPVSVGNHDDPRYNIRVLDRAVRILSLLSDGKPRTPTDISETIELSPSTTFRLLSSLNYYNYVRRDEISNQYQLGLTCLELAQAYLISNDVRRVALPELEKLRDETKETVHLVVMDNMQIIYLEKLPGLHAIGLMSSRVGSRSPAYCTGVGKVLLADQKEEQIREYYMTHTMHRFTSTTITDIDQLMDHLDLVRKQGYAIDDGEHEDEVRCIAAPVYDLTGKVVAAVSISGPAIRLDPLEDNQELIDKAKQTALDISRQLGYAPNR